MPIEIPDDILDTVAEEAKKYYEQQQERLLGAYSEEGKAEVRKLSTHQKVATMAQINAEQDPERKQEFLDRRD